MTHQLAGMTPLLGKEEYSLTVLSRRAVVDFNTLYSYCFLIHTFEPSAVFGRSGLSVDFTVFRLFLA